ncbi:MAG: tetratricopeptide repeat protein [Cyanobacteria bacterium P01_F01_bin.150]
MGHQIESSTNTRIHVDVDFLYRQGESLANLGRHADALAAFDQAIAVYPKMTQSANPHKLAGLWVFRAVVLLHLQSYDDALISCDRALDLEPRNIEALVFRGVALNYLGRYQDSYASYANAMGLANPQKTYDEYSLLSVLSGTKIKAQIGALSRAALPFFQRFLLQNQFRFRLRRFWCRLKQLKFRH